MPGIDATDIDLIVLATATPDQTFPSTATKVQAALGIDDCVAFDVARGVLRFPLRPVDRRFDDPLRHADKALVIGAETFSRILDWEDRATCVLFGDGAGAMVLSAEETESAACSPPSSMPTAGTTTCSCRWRPLDHRHRRQAPDEGPRSVPPRGGQPRRSARTKCSPTPASPPPTSTGSCRTRPTRASSTPRRRNWAADRKVVVTVDRHANTSAASVPLAFDAAMQRRPHQAGRPCRARSDGWRLYLGRSSAQVLKSLEYQAICRIADGAEFRYECVIETAGGKPFRAGEYDGRSRHRAGHQ